MTKPLAELSDHINKVSELVRSNTGKWEAEVEAFNLILQLASYASSLHVLAIASMSLVPSVELVARGAIEAGGKAMWMLNGNSELDREARWLTHLEGDYSVRKRVEDRTSLELNSEDFDSFIQDIRSIFPKNIDIPKQVPKMDQLLKELGMPEKYFMYCIYSQQVHAGHYSTKFYRKHLGIDKQLGEFIGVGDWVLPISIIWWFLAYASFKFQEVVKIPGLDMVPIAIQKKYVHAQNEIKKHA